MKYLTRVHVANDARPCESVFLLYERLPNISIYKFNSLFNLFVGVVGWCDGAG